MESIVPEKIIKACYNEWNEIDPAIVTGFNSYEKYVICKLNGLVRNHDAAQKLWSTYFSKYEFNNFDELSKDDCIFYFLSLENQMALKSPGIYKLLKGHYDY